MIQEKHFNIAVRPYFMKIDLTIDLTVRPYLPKNDKS